jgi:glycine/betaine/sarcosine/D-proline reductase family selenoprotein B
VGIPTVATTALISIAERVGSNRIFKALGRFHYPFGDPSKTPEGERRWRRDVVLSALTTLERPVSRPTVFEYEQVRK